MNRLLIAQCGRLKLPHRAKALDLYQGSLWQSIRAHAPGRARIAALSAKHGLISADQELDPYDQTLTSERISAIEDMPLPRELFAGIREVCMVGGHAYVDLADWLLGQAMADGLLSNEAKVVEIVDQPGFMRSRMNRWLHQEVGADA